MYILTMDFVIPWPVARLMRKTDGSADTDAAARFFDEETVRAITAFPGLKWKVWAISADARHGAGVYLFENLDDAKLRAAYAKKFYKRSGLLHTQCHIYEVLEDSSKITHAALDTPANPTATPEQAAAIMHPKRKNPLKMLATLRRIAAK